MYFLSKLLSIFKDMSFYTYGYLVTGEFAKRHMITRVVYKKNGNGVDYIRCNTCESIKFKPFNI